MGIVIAFTRVWPEFTGGHEVFNHKSGEYVRGDANANPVESYFALPFLRGASLAFFTTFQSVIFTNIVTNSLSVGILGRLMPEKEQLNPLRA